MDNQEIVRKERAFKSMLIFGIFSIVMLFAGLTSAYIVSKGALTSEEKWSFITLPITFQYSTFAIVLSSLFAILSFKSLKKNNLKQTKWYLIVTLLLGFLFSFLQFQGWSDLVSEGHFFAGKDSNVAASFIYVLTGVHLAHLVAGLIVFLVLLYNLRLKKYNKKKHLSFKLGMWFWHFLGVLWIYLYGFLLYSTVNNDPKDNKGGNEINKEQIDFVDEVFKQEEVEGLEK